MTVGRMLHRRQRGTEGGRQRGTNGRGEKHCEEGTPPSSMMKMASYKRDRDNMHFLHVIKSTDKRWPKGQPHVIHRGTEALPWALIIYI